MNIAVLILAAGQGTRMRSSLPKVLHTIGGRSMLEHVINKVSMAFPFLAPTFLHTVIGHNAGQIKKTLARYSINWIIQQKQLGTGHAVKMALPHCDNADVVLVLYGDVPLIQPETLKQLVALSKGESLALLTVNVTDPKGYGRIIRDNKGKIQAIVEEQDALPEQKTIHEINTGIMAIPGKYLKDWITSLTNNNAQREYYLTDIVTKAVEQSIPITYLHPSSEKEVMGVNNRQQQAFLEREYQHSCAEQLMKDGVTLMDPSRIDIRGHLKTGSDVIIDVNCIFEGDVVLGNNVIVEPGCILRNSCIGDDTHIAAYSIIEEGQVKDQCAIGPFARIRPQTIVGTSAKVGNFVEIKKTNIGKGSKINHLSYIGDAEVGKEVNIGAGTITCNYDGVNKHQTRIGDQAFIGSNSALVAPINIGNNATIGAGSTVTDTVEDEQLAVARSRQDNITGWRRPEKGTPNK